MTTNHELESTPIGEATLGQVKLLLKSLSDIKLEAVAMLMVGTFEDFSEEDARRAEKFARALTKRVALCRKYDTIEQRRRKEVKP